MRIFALVLVALLFSFPALAAPNIVVFVADDLGYAEISSYGGAVNTPNIDRLAAEGTKFTDFHATPFCTPTRASLLTGRYNQRAGLNYALPARTSMGIRASEVTLPEMLSSVYPARIMTGKWHLGRNPQFNPTLHGFTYFTGAMHGAQDYNTHRNESGDMDWWVGRTLTYGAPYYTTAQTAKALQTIDYNAALHRPFFLYVPYQAAHVPYSLPGDPPGTNNGAKRPEIIRLMDRSVGQIMEKIRALPSETFVFFMGDNGGPVAKNGGLRDGKGTVFEGGVRVDAIAWQPGHVPVGVSRETLHVIDLMPTLAVVGGVSLPARQIDGRSFIPVFNGETLAPRRLFWEQSGQRAVRDGDWKLVIAGGRTMLFNLRTDLNEKTDVAIGNPGIVSTLTSAHAAWHADVYR